VCTPSPTSRRARARRARRRRLAVVVVAGMVAPFAFVTLLTSDSYLPGALALAGALKDVHPSPPIYPEVDFETVCLVTPESVDVTTIKLLRKAFDVVVGVELIVQQDKNGLALLGRPDLHAVLTKLHIFRRPRRRLA
jgi:hypothetical protein